jgi:hypothetical protein
MKQVTVQTYRQDTYYPRVVRAVATILVRSDVVAPVDVLLEMGNLTPKHHEAWYRGHVPYLERVFAGSLSKAHRILRLIGFHVHDLNMVPRRTVYYQGGQRKNRRLRFSKSGQAGLEEAYATHYVWNQSQETKRHVIARSMPAHSQEG